MKFDIVTIGSAVLDVLLKSSQFKVLPVQEELLVCEIYGGKMDVDEAIVVSGGAATNCAVSFARQGFNVACVSEVGVDIAAQVVWDDLHRSQVHTQLLVQEPAEHTGISSILVASDGSRSAMTYRGSAHQLQIGDLDFDALTNVRAIHLSNVGDYNLIAKVQEHCQTHNIFLSWNPGKLEAIEMYVKRGLGKSQVCDVLFLNDQEWECVKSVESNVKRSAKILVITRGKQGGEIIADGVSTPYQAKTVPVIDETGAGDAFAAGFVGAHLRGETLSVAIAFAIDNASSVVGYMGAKEGLLKVT